MRTYIIKRLLLMIPTLLGVTIVTFGIIQLAPSDPTSQFRSAGEAQELTTKGLSPGNLRLMRKQWNLDKPAMLNLHPFRDYRERVFRLLGYIRDRRVPPVEDLFALVRAGRRDEALDKVKALHDDWSMPQLESMVLTALDEKNPARRAGEAAAQERQRLGEIVNKARKWFENVGRWTLPHLFAYVEARNDLETQGVVYAIVADILDDQTLLAESGHSTARLARIEAYWRSWWAENERRLQVPVAVAGRGRRLVDMLPAGRSGIVLGELDGLDRSRSPVAAARRVRAAGFLRDLGADLGQEAGWAERWLERLLGRDGAEELARLETLARKEASDSLANLGVKAYPALFAALDEATAALDREEDGARQRKVTVLRWIARARPEERPKVEGAASPESYARVAWFWQSWWGEHRGSYDMGIPRMVFTALTETQYFLYVWKLVSGPLDFGLTMDVKREKVLDRILQHMKVSVTMMIISTFFIYVIAIPMGIFSAVSQNSISDRFLTFILFVLYSVPSFVGAVLLLFLFSLGHPWEVLPIDGLFSPNVKDLNTFEALLDFGWHMVLPIACLTYGGLASMSRYMRSGMLEVIRQDYIRTARAKGLPERIVVLKHALRNGLIPVITLFASLLPLLLGGSVIIESIFSVKGMGWLALESILAYDYTTLLGITVIMALLVQAGILVSDLMYALVDPQISFDSK